jgi:hypothetical protein
MKRSKLKTVVFLAVLAGMAWTASWLAEQGGYQTMQRLNADVSSVRSVVPPIDAHAPKRFETATFAMG